jgi:hypothetical protein
VAHTIADEAVSVVRTQEAPVRECLALLTRVHALRLGHGAAAAASASPDIAAGLELAQESGAKTFEPFLLEERGRLAGDPEDLHRALTLYAAMGARGHARRLEAELGVSAPAPAG